MSNRPFVGARLEEFVFRRVNGVLRRFGWVEAVVPFTGYGSQSQVRVLARVVLRPAEARTQFGRAAEEFLMQRGWRNFLAAPIPRAEVNVTVGHSGITLRTDRNGYVDVRVKSEVLDAGWNHVTIATPTSLPTDAPVMVVDDEQTFGLVSDIDDTVISTFLPRLFIAAWNSLVVTEQARQPVPGMARMLTSLLGEHPGAPIIYVSTGAWSTFSFLNRFLTRHGFPMGPMLLTDWGPTNTGWVRSGSDHKRQALRELARDFPNISWVLIGDDGQHDPMLYAEFAELQPDHVRAIAIRELTMAEQVLAHGTTTVLVDNDEVQWTPESAPEVRGPDGWALLPQVQQILADTEAPLASR